MNHQQFAAAALSDIEQFEQSGAGAEKIFANATEFSARLAQVGKEVAAQSEAAAREQLTKWFPQDADYYVGRSALVLRARTFKADNDRGAKLLGALCDNAESPKRFAEIARGQIDTFNAALAEAEAIRAAIA